MNLLLRFAYLLVSGMPTVGGGALAWAGFHDVPELTAGVVRSVGGAVLLAIGIAGFIFLPGWIEAKTGHDVISGGEFSGADP